MSIKVMTWAFEQPLAGNEKVVLLALADFADDDGRCWPSMSRIAEKACVSDRTVQRIMTDLSDQGYVSTVKRSSENGRSLANEYLLHIKGEGDNLTGWEGDKLSEGDTAVTHEGDTVVTPLKGTTRKNRQDKTIGARVPEDFSPDERAVKLATSLGLSPQNFQTQFDAFMDYWRAVPGAKGRKLDWQGTFRNWLRNSKKFDHAKLSPKQPARRSILEQFLND